MATYYENVTALAPKVWFKFNETSGTPSNSGSDTCTLTEIGSGNSPYLNQSGIVNKSIRFARQKYYKFSTLSNVMNDKSFSIEFWHKPYEENPTTGTNDGALFSISKALASNYVSVRYTDNVPNSGLTYPGTYSVAFRGGGSTATVYSLRSSQVSTYGWHHIVLTVSTSALILYIDGVNVASQTNPVFGSDFDFDTATRTRNIAESLDGYLDEVAIYGQTLTAQQVLDNYNSAFNSINLATPITASALAVDPAVSHGSTITATALTASAASGAHFNSTRDFFTPLDTYMSTLALEQWYKFDENKTIINYGSGGNSGYLFDGSAYNAITSGVQGSGALRITGSTNTSIVTGITDANLDTEITDGDFSLGFWVKKSTAESAMIFSTNDEADQFFNVEFNSSGYIRTNAHLNNQDHVIETTTSYADGNWHYVAVRKSNSTMQMWVDNVSKGTVSVTHSFGDMLHLDFGPGTGSNSELMYVSQFYIAPSSVVNGTQIANIWNYGSLFIHAGAAMAMPKFSRDNAFNTFVLSKSPHIYFKMDNAAGVPQNSGSDTVTLSAVNSSYTQNITSPNWKAFNFSNRDTQFNGAWTATSGTYTTDNTQTLLMYAKFDYAANNYIGGSAGFGGITGGGLLLQHLSSGLVRLRASDANYLENLSSTTAIDDGNYHMIVAVKDGSDLRLYIDGKEEAYLDASEVILTDSGQVAIGGAPALIPASSSRNLTIDEFAVFSTAFSAEEVLNAYQAIDWVTDWTATATIVAPTVSAGYGPTINATAYTVTAAMGPVFKFTVPMTSQALLQQPNFEATDFVNVIVDAMTASAQAEEPGWNIGEINAVLHMDASAYFPQPQLLIPGFWFDNPKIATATIVQPAISTTLGALIKPQSLNANAFLPVPPAYYLVADDKWYQRLLDVDYQSADYEGTITFFNTSNSIYLDGTYGGWKAYSSRSPFIAGYGMNMTDSPLPVASAGYFDPVNRKALNLRNISLAYTSGAGSDGYTKGWTMEMYIQTTKKNQYIAEGGYNSQYSSSKLTGIRLKDGKIAFTTVKDRSNGFLNSSDEIAYTGFKDIADGNWHHLIIQFRDDDNRTQVWIDGKLDIQRYGYVTYVPHKIGYNSNDINAYSDFTISGIAINKESFVLEREQTLNYFAAIGSTPIEVKPAEASVILGTETRGKGNRARALMLYFWPTFNAESGYYVGQNLNPFSPVGVNTSNGHDVGAEPFDYDTFYGLTTYLTDKTQTFFDWDIFPLPVKNFYSGDTYRGDKNPLLKETVMIDTGTNGTTYIDPVTGNYRYLNLMEDVYELDQYDAIFFRNYPDQSKEQDAMGLNSKTEVDEYFNLQEKTLFAEFLDNLRTTIDTYGISLFVTNPQLAKDLGIIANATEVPLLRNQGNFYADEYSDNRAPVVTGRVALDGTPTDGVNVYGAGWYDTWFNDRHRVINTLEYLTDDNAFIWTDYAYYQNADELIYGGPDRLYKRYENRPYGLQIDDEFVFADSGSPTFRLPYQAVKPSDLLAGIPITALSKKIWNQNYGSYVQVDNPYKDYITTIALPPGTNLKGKLTTGKIFVSFSENVSNAHTYANPQYRTNYIEYHSYDMASNYWVDIAYNAGIINDVQRAQYKAGTASQPPLYDDNDTIKQYWSLSGDNIISRLEPVTQNLKGFVGGDIPTLLQNPLKTRTRTGLQSLNSGERLRDALGRFASGGGASSVTGGNLNTFKVVVGRTYDTGNVFIPSINTRGLWWLSDKIRLTGKVVGSPAMTANAAMPNPLVEADHPTTVIAGAMIASSTINETQFKSGSRNIVSLPMYASATINGIGGKNVLAGTPATASATIVSAFAITQGAEQVIMYLHHVNPIVYLRKEIIR